METILTYHVEGERQTASREIYGEIERQVRLADELGYHAVWLAEHHFHVHRGHTPNPLLHALWLAGRTKRIHAGSAIICTALHHPLRLAEDMLLADALTGGRLSIGLGSGSTPSEFQAFGVPADQQGPEARHARFAEQLDVIEQAWRGEPIDVSGEYVRLTSPAALPAAIRPLADVLWIAANSPPQAMQAGRHGYGLMLSRERSLEEMQRLYDAFVDGRREAGLAPTGGRIAASRALLVGESDAAAAQTAAEAVEIMVQRQRVERPAFRDLPPPQSFAEACERVKFLVGAPETIAQDMAELRRAIPITAFHIQPRWQGLPPHEVEASIARFQRDVVPAL